MFKKRVTANLGGSTRGDWEHPTKEVMEKRSLSAQIEFTRQALRPESEVYWGLCEVTALIEMFFNYLEKEMDKKMAKVTKQMKTAGREMKKGDKAEAMKTLKKAEKKNVKLTKLDRTVRDPEIKAYKKMKKKGC